MPVLAHYPSMCGVLNESLVDQSLTGQSSRAPAYITDDMQLIADSDRRQFQSATDRVCLDPRTYNYGD